MTWTDPSPFKVNYFGVNTGFGSTGEWILFGKPMFLCNTVVLSI